MSKLTYAQRQRLPDSAFAIPSKRKYPITDTAHARNALARVSAHGSPMEKHLVCKKVTRKFPGVHAKSCPLPYSMHRLRA